MAIRSSAEILSDVERTLATARAGLEDVLGSRPERRVSGLSNVVVFGRAVTNVLQNLRSTESTFDEWYRPHVETMKADPLLKYLYERRTTILKVGTVGGGAVLHLTSFTFPPDMSKFGPPPPGARAFFMGDTNGGVGWEVVVADGSVEKYYVQLPGEIGDVDVVLGDAPLEHLGNVLPDRSIATICRAYVEYLERLVNEAKSRFGAKA